MTNHESAIANNRPSRIYIAGHRGLVGSALMRKFEHDAHAHLITRTHAELDLTDQQAINAFFTQEKPEYVFLAAAKVGGILANDTYPAEFIQQNLMIQTNVIDAAYRHGVKRLLFLGSSCIYPRDCPQPIKEEYLLTGPLEATNRAYALAKIAGIEMCWAYNRQYATQYIAVMPTNLYGPGDNYDLEKSHVIPALIRKVHLAKMARDGNLDSIIADEVHYGRIPDELLPVLGLERASPDGSSINNRLRITHHAPKVQIWGTGTPRREFLYSDDMADACVYLMNLTSSDSESPITHHQKPPLINMGCGIDLTIRELAEAIAETVGFDGELEFDNSKPDGTVQKRLDVSQLTRLGWVHKTDLAHGLARAYKDFLNVVEGRQ